MSGLVERLGEAPYYIETSRRDESPFQSINSNANTSRKDIVHKIRSLLSKSKEQIHKGIDLVERERLRKQAMEHMGKTAFPGILKTLRIATPDSEMAEVEFTDGPFYADSNYCLGLFWYRSPSASDKMTARTGQAQSVYDLTGYRNEDFVRVEYGVIVEATPEGNIVLYSNDAPKPLVLAEWNGDRGLQASTLRKAYENPFRETQLVHAPYKK